MFVWYSSFELFRRAAMAVLGHVTCYITTLKSLVGVLLYQQMNSQNFEPKTYHLRDSGFSLSPNQDELNCLINS